MLLIIERAQYAQPCSPYLVRIDSNAHNELVRRLGPPRWLSGKDLPANAEDTGVRSLVQEAPQEKEMAAHSSILAWEIPWTEEPGRSRGHKESDTTCQPKRRETWTAAFPFSLFYVSGSNCYGRNQWDCWWKQTGHQTLCQCHAFLPTV